MNIGMMNVFEVLRETDISYLLTDGTNEIFLHKKEALRPYETGEKIQVFLYVDNQGRPTASTKTPFITTESGAFLEVVEVNHDYGVFLHNGLVKDVLLSKDDLPMTLNQWPIIGDKLFVTLKVRKNQLYAKQITRKSIRFFMSEQPIVLEDNTLVQAHVLFLLDDGLVCFSNHGHEIFVHYNNTRRKYRLGEPVEIKILKMNENQEYVGTLIGQKELMLEPDANQILSFLERHNGTMRFTDKSTPEEIQMAFQMSKSAFKRALGSLYKAGLVLLQDDSTIAIEKIKQN